VVSLGFLCLGISLAIPPPENGMPK
jgi:hypothetical protein